MYLLHPLLKLALGYISACLHTALAHWLCVSGQHLSPSRQLTHVPAIVAYSTSTQPLHLSLPLHLYFSTPQEAVLTAGAKYIRQYEWIQLYCLSYNTLIFCPSKHKLGICRCDTQSKCALGSVAEGVKALSLGQW